MLKLAVGSSKCGGNWIMGCCMGIKVAEVYAGAVNGTCLLENAVEM